MLPITIQASYIAYILVKVLPTTTSTPTSTMTTKPPKTEPDSTTKATEPTTPGNTTQNDTDTTTVGPQSTQTSGSNDFSGTFILTGTTLHFLAVFHFTRS